jgi:hypothetical protein
VRLVESVLSEPRAAGKPWLPIQQRRLSEIRPQGSERALKHKKADAIKLFGPHEVYKTVAQRLLDDTCRYRTGRLEEDGCWPDWSG